MLIVPVMRDSCRERESDIYPRGWESGYHVHYNLDRGASRKRYKDQLKRQLAQAGISRQSWQQEASDRDSWHSSVRKASCEFEAEMHKPAKEKRRRQKERAASLLSLFQTFVCPKCGRECASRIGLYSHQRARKN